MSPQDDRPIVPAPEAPGDTGGRASDTRDPGSGDDSARELARVVSEMHRDLAEKMDRLIAAAEKQTTAIDGLPAALSAVLEKVPGRTV